MVSETPIAVGGKSPKKAAAVKPIFMRPKRGVDRRLKKVCKRHDKSRIEVAHDGLLAEIERLEKKIPGLSERDAAAVISARRFGVDVLAILRDATIAAANPPPPPSAPANISAG
jgi:hypothetical protein